METNPDPPDPVLVENIANYLKSQGIFDEFRHECLSDIDTKSSFQNLRQRVDGFTTKFLANVKWTPDLDKNEVRNQLRQHIHESGMLESGTDHFIDQVISPQIEQVFIPKITEVVHQYLDNEKEKLNKKQETVSSEKISTETTTETKTTVIDPIADILSFTCSKRKPVASAPVQNAQTKVFETSKVEKKKEEVAHQTKTPNPTPKTDKKKEILQPAKARDALLKAKKGVSDQTSAADIAVNLEKEEVSHPSIKTGTVELPKEMSSVPTLQTKSLDDSKELEKVVKPVKVAACETGFETPKKVVKNVKHEKKKVDNLKLQIPEQLLQSEENSENKSSPTVKSSSSSKSKLESPKHKKKKPLGLGVIRTPSKVVESHKSNVRESSDSSSDNISMDQSKVSAKLPNVRSKECSSPLKKTITPIMVMCKKGGDSVSKSKPKGTVTKSSEECSSALKNTVAPIMVMCEKGGGSVSKNKPKGTPTKSSDKPGSSKVGSLRKEDSSVKFKYSSEKHEKTKTLKISDPKPDAKIQSESSSSSDKGSKHSYSSSYDLSKGSDLDRSFSSVSSKEKVKHFSKHQREDSSSADSIDKPSPEKKRPQSDSDSGTPKKDKGQKASKYQTEKQRKSFTVQESAKITSRSDSISSASSTSNSQASLKESSVIISSGETSESSSKNSEKKKSTSKDKEPCSGSRNLPPPSPPPPTSGLPMASSAEMSSMDETLSSQESEFELSGNSDEEISSEPDEENPYGSSSNQELSLKAIELHNEIQDISQFSSSSSEFEGFNSSPEKAPRSEMFSSDVSVSSVHTSDLSSFEDELSDVECAADESGKSKKRFTIKEAEEILEARAEQQRLAALKTVSQKELDDKKNQRSSLQNSAIGVELSEIEVPPAPEPKRESRRERKLNPKYASNEYTSIFDCKHTSFIKKQSTQNEVKLAASKKNEADLLPAKGTMTTKRKSSATAPDKTLSNNVGSKVPTAESGKNLISLPSASESVMLEFSSEDISETKLPFIASDKSPNTLSETGSPNRIALKIKLSASKNDNETNKDPNVHGTKRKFMVKGKGPAKKVCNHDCVNSSNLESIANENKPFNNKSKLSSTVLSVGRENDKEIFHKQKVNNGDVLNKI